ncbi:MAG: Ig-like domain-containing protein [Promethearchaeota archaeon]
MEFLSGITNSEGLATFIFDIPENWASKTVKYYAYNSPKLGFCLQRKTNVSSITIRPLYTRIIFSVDKTDLYVNENYTFNFELLNDDLQKLIENAQLIITISNETYYEQFEVITSYNSSLNLKFLTAGLYYIEIDYYGSSLYLECHDYYTIEILKRPTYFSIDVTEMDLVPGNNFSITVNLFDAFTNESIQNKWISVFENIYDNGSLVEDKFLFDVLIPLTNTFSWKPLREADFEFVFHFVSNDDIYQDSYYSLILNVSKRQVLIEPSIQNFDYKIDEFVRFNTTFTDLNTTNSDPIPGLLVHYLILDGENIIYSQNHTTNEEGIIEFEWQIPSSLINKNLTILIITEESNYYQSYFNEIKITTAPLKTYFNIIITPNPHSYINEDIIIEIEFLTTRGEKVEDEITYEITCEDLSYYESSVINLSETSLLTKSFSEAGKYIYKFYYLGSELYAPTEKEIVYFIELYPSKLNLIDYPEYIYPEEDTINLIYQLIDTFNQQSISGSLVKLFYIDFTTSTKIFLNSLTTDLDGKVNFLVSLPEAYAESSIIFIAETNQTTLNEGASNSVELLITESPTYIDFAALTDSYQYYIDENLNITFELYDYFDNLLITETLYLEIETPTNYLTLQISCNQTIQFNFTELGLYRINASYSGSSLYLPTYTQIYYGVSPIPTSLEFTEKIPEILYSDEHLFLRARLENNLTGMPIKDEIVKFFITNSTSKYLIYEGITDNEGLISCIWDIEPKFIGQEVNISAVYDYADYYNNCSTPKISTFISKYNVELNLVEFPDSLSPFLEEQFIIEVFKLIIPSDVASNCHIQLSLLLPNGTRIIIKDGFTDNFGVIEFSWTPYRDIFEFNNAIFEIYVIDDDQYYGGLILTKEISIDKLQTSISIIPEKFQVLPGELVIIHFDLIDIYERELLGQIINVKIENPLFLTSFKIEIGFNNSYEFLIPNYGAFEIIGSYEGTDRYYPSSNETEIYSEKFELEIDLSILEAFSVVESTDFLGTYLNYSILDFNNNLTLVANVTIKDYDIPYEDAEVSFFFLQKNKEPILIGSNITNKEGIAIFNWDTSNYTTTNWWKNTAILAKIDETEYNYAAESNPIYFNLRKIKTSLELELFTSKFRIDINYDINITLYDEFLIALKGYNLSVDIYFKGKITQSYEIVTNDTTFFNFTPTKLGNYIIKVYFAGTEEYKESQLTEEHKCVEKEPTNIQTNLPEYIRPGELYSINVILFNSTGGLLIGELVAIQIICHDESGSTEYFYLDLIIGDNNTFDWIFPEYDEYIIKATYKGTDDYLGCKVNFKAQSIFTFSLSFWETFFIILVPALMITPSFNFKIKTSKGKRRKKIFLVIFLVITILFSSYSGIALICSQTERTGLIKDLKAISNYYPEDPLTQNQDTMNDLYDYGGSTLEKINPEWIPNLENDTESYDLVLENSTIIPPELDMNPPRLWFSEISNGDILREKTTIKLGVFDRESGVHEVLFKLLYQGITLVKEDFFYYDPISDLYIYNLSTTDYVDGEYVIYALAIDNNNNNNTASVEIRIVNNPIYDVDPTEYENVKAELTDYINISFTSIANGTYNLKILDLNYKTIIKMSDSITTEKMNTLEILIDPLFFKASDYIILITILMLNVLGIVVKETKELNLQVLKESVKLEIDIMEDDNIYSNHLINVKARLVENDKYLSESDELIEIEPKTPIPGQVLTFEMGDRDNPQTLGTTVTDINGYATFNYNVSVAKGQHIFNVTFQGNNIYQPIEEMKLFKNKGKYMNIQLVYVSNNIPYNEIGNISAVLLADEKRLSNQTLYFNISNSENNYYLGMASTDTNGEAKLLFPCDYAPGEYDIIVSYDGKSIYADNVSIFKGKLNITLQDVALSIQTGMGSDIHCPYYYNTSLVANLLEDDTNNGIEDIMVTFEAILFPSGTKYPIGSSLTDPNGLASINFNPSLISNLIPGNYILNVNTSGNDFYKESSDTANLIISKDIPIISIQGTETLFHTEFQINATLTDSQLNPIQGAALNFYIINSSKSPEEILYNGKAETNSNGTATLKVQPEEFPYLGKFDIFVFFDGMQNLIYDSTSNMVKYGLQVFQHTTLLLIQGPEKGNVIDPYEIDLFLLDKEGTPITGQKVLIECYKEGGITNLLRPNTHVITDNLYGNATFSLNITVPGTFIIKALYLPLFDDDVYNNGYLSSQSEIRFIIERVPADLSITKINLPRIMRGDIFKFTVETGLEEAKREDIPINIFVDIDLNGDGIKHDDIFRGKYFFIENGTGVIAYNIPVDDTFQAGQHKFTVVIDEEWSSFTGSTSFLIDFIERTTLEIKYHFLNPNASGRHYLWEEEQIEFILRDEDGDPLPYSCNIKDGSMIVTNRTIYYQIVNGKNTYGTAHVTLEDGNYSIYYTPTKYGFETSTVTYQGARFFAPSNSRRIAKILRRPLNLTFIDYWHNNPNRPDVKHSGHRGEIITIVARIQDYLNGSNLKNQIVDFGYYIHHFRDIIRYLDISNKSDNNGWVYINVKLNVTNKLIQAGNYQLRLKIKMNDYYQPIEVSHQDRLRIFEIGHIGINIGAISMEDMNYVMKPTICLYDEDNRVVRNVEFYIQLLEMRTNQVAHDQYMSSGRVEIAIMNAGLYEIRVSIADEDIAELLNIQEIASYFNQSLYVFLLTKVANILVSDDYVPYIYIPIISDVLYFALEYAVKWKAGIYSFLLLLVLNIFSGYIGEYVGLTWMDLLKLILFTAFCGLFEYSRWFLYGFLRMYEEDVDDYWLLLSVSKLINSLKSPSWFIVAISLIAIDLILIQFNFREFKLDIDLNVEVILIELLILFIAGLIEFIFHNLPSILEPLRRGLIYLGKRIWDTFHKYKEYHEKLISVLPIASYIIFIISDALIGFVIDLIFDLIPKPDDPFLAFLIDIARLALKYSLIIGVNVVISIYGGGPSNIAAQAIKEAVKQVIKKVVEKLIIDMLSKVLFDFLFDIIIPI